MMLAALIRDAPKTICLSNQEQCPCHGEVPGLDPAAWSKRERADGVAQRPVAIPDGALDQEDRHEDRTGRLAAAQQSASPALRLR